MQDKEITFFTDRTDHDPLIYRSTKIHVTPDLFALQQYLENKVNSNARYIGFDIEANGNKFYFTDMLLVSIGEKDQQFVVDCTSGNVFEAFKKLINQYTPKLILMGHNIKYDYQHCFLNGIYFNQVFDTMIAEQRINLGLNLLNNLAIVYERRLKKYMETNKDTRLDFLKMNKRSTFHITHIVYSAKDIAGIIDIAKIQRDILRERGQYEWFRENENGIVTIIGDMEMEGLYLYKDKWRAIIEQRKVERLETERKLDDHLRKAGFKIKMRNRVTVEIPELFGDYVAEVDNKNVRHINYSSSVQFIKVIKKMGEPVPVLRKKGKVSNSVSETAILQYIVENPNTPIKKMLMDYIEYKGHEKFITSYGLKFLNSEIRKKKKREPGFKNEHTGNVHTSYRQCATETGRLSSGDSKQGRFNSQNLPAKKNIREAFGLTEKEIKDGWYFTTCDLSGAELIIMAALADDQHLYELGADKIINGKKVEGDLHSPIVTKYWKAVHDYRLERKRDMTIYDSESVPYILTPDFFVAKNNNGQLRKDGKPMTFGTIYGLRDNKAGQTLNIPKDEGGVAIKVIENEFPRTFKMVKEASMLALIDGYVIFNSISNNRRQFGEILALIEKFNLKDRDKRYNKIKSELTFTQLSEIEGAARNCRIQGTQADMIKESKRRVVEYATKHKIESKLLLSVHDELGVKHKGKEFGSDIAQIMTETANRYLEPYSSNIRMRCDFHTGYTWTK